MGNNWHSGKPVLLLDGYASVIRIAAWSKAMKRLWHIFCFIGWLIISYHAWIGMNADDLTWRFLVTYTCVVSALGRFVEDMSA
jgi:hypothetical protein